MKFNFTIDQFIESERMYTKITNDTMYDIVIKINPIPPKRKYCDIFVIQKGTYLVLDNHHIHLDKISVFFEEAK